MGSRARASRPSLLAGARIDSFLPLHLDPFEIDALINEHGNACEYRRAVVCPCSRIESGQGNIGCPVCRGLGWAYPSDLRCLSRFLDQSRSPRSKNEPAGLMFHGQAQVTFRIGIVPSVGDIVLPECETHVVLEHFNRDVQQIDAQAEAVKLPPRGLPRPLPVRVERLLYPEVFEVEAVAWIEGDALISGTEGLHFRQAPTSEGGTKIEFLSDYGPDRGGGYSVRYIARAAYMVQASAPNFRHEGDVAMPYRSMIERLDKVQEADLR